MARKLVVDNSRFKTTAREVRDLTRTLTVDLGHRPSQLELESAVEERRATKQPLQPVRKVHDYLRL